MVPVDGHCIDATLVTQAQYADFVSAICDDVRGQRAGCDWNSTYRVEVATCVAAPAHPPFDPAATPNAPAVCVDW